MLARRSIGWRTARSASRSRSSRWAIQPDRPATEYGYLRPDTMRATTVEGVRAYPLIAFEEKPTEHRARELINLPGVAWNAGMFALAARRDPGRAREVHAADRR